MADLPTGTVTFLLTDIEGSTRLWEAHAAAMGAAVARHDALIAEAVAAHGGVLLKTQGEGDSAFAVFARATDAVATALESQRALIAESWGTTGPLAVRMALHTGEAELREGDYFGPAVNRCARLRAITHGGQVLLSHLTAELVRDHLPTGAELRDIGQHRLRDLVRPEHVSQLVARDLPADFPPLRSLDARPHNLPVQPTSLIGRERELASIHALLREDVRLVTLTGPGGSGKTRLALQVAANALDDFADGVFFVNLAPITDPGLVAPIIAQALGVREAAGRPVQASLSDYLRARALLLVLDNFEQVVVAAPLVADLLATCVRLKVLVTSREGLHLRGEHHVPVPPLALPDPQCLPPLERLTQCEAVRLFIERAVAARPDFAVTNDNAPAVAEICCRLDGLPLAIELAAARSRLFAPQALLARLQHRLKVLTGGPRDLPARQQTLRDAIGWSYDLLSREEQALFRRLSVFVGGWTLEAAEAVCNPGGDLGADVLDGLASLVDKNLAHQADMDGEPRFGMLETIREFGQDQLAATAEADLLRQCHSEYFFALAEQAQQEEHAPHRGHLGLPSTAPRQRQPQPSGYGPQRNDWLTRLEAEHDNIRAALDWLLTTGTVERALQLAHALRWFWQAQAHEYEGRQRVAAILAAARHGPAPLQAATLRLAGQLAMYHGDFAQAEASFAESLEMHRMVGDTSGVAAILHELSMVAVSQDQLARGTRLAEQSLAVAREADDRAGIAVALSKLGELAWRLGDLARAVQHYEASLALQRELGNPREVAILLGELAGMAHRQGDDARAQALQQECVAAWQGLGDARGLALSLLSLGQAVQFGPAGEQAIPLFEQSLALYRAVADKPGMASVLLILGVLLSVRGNQSRAALLLGEAVTLEHETGYKPGIANCLEGLGAVVGLQGRPFAAARLLGAGEALREAVAFPRHPAYRAFYDRTVNAIRARADAGEFAAAFEVGRALSLDEAIAEALAVAAETG